MDILRKRFSDWNDDEKLRLRDATLANGVMRDFMVAFPDSPTIVAFEKTQVMGWVFILPVGHTGCPFVSVYVVRKFRKSGVATQLIEEVLQDYGCIALTIWNKKTGRLFTRLHREHPESIIVFPWLEEVRTYRQMVDDALWSYECTQGDLS